MECVHEEEGKWDWIWRIEKEEKSRIGKKRRGKNEWVVQRPRFSYPDLGHGGVLLVLFSVSKPSSCVPSLA